MVGHISLNRIHGRDVYLIRIYNNMKELTDPTKCAINLYVCAEVVCSKEALEAFNEVKDQEELHEFEMEEYNRDIAIDKALQNINQATFRASLFKKG